MRCVVIVALWAAGVSQLAGADCPMGCPKKCPSQVDVQSDFVRQHFDVKNFWGTFYEIAFHDSTQPTMWPIKAACQRSVKSRHPGDPRSYKDLFSLNEGPGKGVNAVCDLEFNISDLPGVFMGHWQSNSFWNPDLTDIANTVVDVGVAPNGTYTWTLEFQCRDDEKGINFAAVNFYHRNPVISAAELEEMKRRLRARGLGWIIDLGLTMVDQQKCIDHDSYPAIDAKPFLCGQKGLESSPHVTAGPRQALAPEGCPDFLKPICDLADSVRCVLSCMPRLGECIKDTDCVNSVKELGTCMAKMKAKNATADETQSCLVPDNKLRSDFVYCLMDDPGCVSVPTPPSQYPACADHTIEGDGTFSVQHILGDWYKIKGWRKGEIVECLPCQQVKFWSYDPVAPLPWPSPKPWDPTDYTVISSSWHEQDSHGKYWPMNQTSLWGPRAGREGFPGKEFSMGTMFGIGYAENYTVVHDGSAEPEPFVYLYACGRTKQGDYVSGLVLGRAPASSASLRARIAEVAASAGFDDGEWCDVDNTCAADPLELLV